MKNFLYVALLVLMIPTTAVAKGGLGDRIVALENDVATLQSNVTALQSGQAVNVTAIAANAAAIAANAAAIATDAATIAANRDAITGLDGRVAVNEGGISSIAAGLSELETRVSLLEESHIPIYRTAAELPTDGSVLLAFFQPEGGIYGPFIKTPGQLIADRWLMVFDGVTTILGDDIFTTVDGSFHEFPNGWYPAASGVSELEGLIPVAATYALQDSIIQATGFPSGVNLDGTSVGLRIQQIAAMLAGFINDCTGGGIC